MTEIKETQASLDDSYKLVESKIVAFLQEAVASEKFVDPDEQFDGFLGVALGEKKIYDFNLQTLKTIRDFSRVLSISDEVVQNVLLHYKNHIVGDGVYAVVLPKDLGDDPEALGTIGDNPEIEQMLLNWSAFYDANQMTDRLLNWVERVHRDGEVFLRIFPKGKKFGDLQVPVVRFVDPAYIEQDSDDAPLGIYTSDTDQEEIKGYNYAVDGKKKKIKAEEMIHDKRNVDIDTQRGFPSLYSVFTNIRRASKNMVNVSVLTSILSAIALIRKHQSPTQSKIQSFLGSNSDGRARTNSVSGATQYARHLSPGTIIDAPMNTEYEYPAHSVQTKNYIEVIDKELAMVGIRFVLPVEWLKSGQPDKPLDEGSPTIKNFRTEQQRLYTPLEELFWRVQFAMGIDESKRAEFKVSFFGPNLATASTLDQAHANEIEQRAGVLSPQTWCAMNRRNYVAERANTIKHRLTKQPDEVMPGDLGNTNPGADGKGGDGVSKKDGGSRNGANPKSEKPKE